MKPPYTCKLCNREFSKINGLSKHLSHTHKVFPKQYYDEFIRQPNEGYCVVCGNEVPFNRFGYHTKTCSKSCENLLKFPVTIEFWKDKGLSEDEAKNKLSEIQSKNSKKVKNRKSNTTLQYFLDSGLSETDAISALKNRQSTRLKSKYIERYGEVDGIRKWKETNKKWSKKIEKKYKNGEFSKAPKNKIFKVTSTNELSLANELQEHIKTELLFGENQLRIFDGNLNYYYDICDLSSKKIIEYNGDYWHANPRKYKANEIVRDGKTASELWEKDILKKELALKLGYKIFTIWEDEYVKNKDLCIKKCLAFLKNEN